jgi:hypothetical protein
LARDSSTGQNRKEGAMKRRSPVAVLLLPCITFGIYAMVWYYKTKEEMVSLGASIPTFFFVFIPVLNLYWMWKWCGGVEHVTKKQVGAIMAFILICFLSVLGMAIVQSKLNAVAAPAPAAAQPAAG